MAVDTTLRYGTFNTYLLGDGEWLHADPFDVENYSHITIQAVVIRLDGQAITNARFTGRWLDSAGKKLGSEINHGFTTTNKFQRITQTWAVPTNAVKIAWRIEGGYGGYHVACPMIEPGQIASSFDPSVASMVAWHDSSGSYVGFLNANQIVAGILRSVIGNSGFDLDGARIWMTSRDGEITWEATPENPLVIKDNNDNILGGLALINNVVRLITNALADDPESGKYVKLGSWTAPADTDKQLEAREMIGIQLFLPAYSSANPVMTLGVVTEVDGVPLTSYWTELAIMGEVILFAGNDFFNVFVENARLNMVGDSSAGNYGIVLEIRDSAGKYHQLKLQNNLLQLETGGTMAVRGFYSDLTQTEITRGIRSLGIDGTGVYKSVSGTKTYL